MINSRLGHFTAALTSSRSVFYHQQGHPLSRSYGVNMPSSLTMVFPIALVYSTRLPVSVLVRAPKILPRGFSRKHGITDFTHVLRLTSQVLYVADFPTTYPTRFHGDVQNPARLPFFVTPSVQMFLWRYRNIYLLCIGYASLPHLSSRLTLGGLALPRNP